MFRWTVHLNAVQYGYSDQNVAVAVGDNVYSFVCNRWNQIVVYVLNTASLSWNRLATGRGSIVNKDYSGNWCFKAVLVEDVIYLLDLRRDMLYALDVDNRRWFEPRTSGAVPEMKQAHYCACALGKVMFIYGGHRRLTGYNNGLHKLDTTTMVWSLIDTTGTPPGPSGHSATIIGTKMFVFWGERRQDNNLRVFDPETNHWLSSTSASKLPRHHSAIVHNEELYTFDNNVYTSYSNYMLGIWNHMWKFNPEGFSWKEVKTLGNCPSQNLPPCCCMVGDRVIFFDNEHLFILDLNPSLKTLCKLAVIHNGLEQSGLPHNVRWELTAMENKHHQNTR